MGGERGKPSDVAGMEPPGSAVLPQRPPPRGGREEPSLPQRAGVHHRAALLAIGGEGKSSSLPQRASRHRRSGITRNRTHSEQIDLAYACGVARRDRTRRFDPPARPPRGPPDRSRGGDLSGRSARVSPRMGAGSVRRGGERVAARAAFRGGRTRRPRGVFYRRKAGARFFADLDASPADPARHRLHDAIRRDPTAHSVLDDPPGHGHYLLVEFPGPD